MRNSRSSVRRSASQKPPTASAGARRTVMLVASTGIRSAISAHSNAAGASRTAGMRASRGTSRSCFTADDSTQTSSGSAANAASGTASRPGR